MSEVPALECGSRGGNGIVELEGKDPIEHPDEG